MKKVKIVIFLSSCITVIAMSIAFYFYSSMKVVHENYLSSLQDVALINIANLLGINKRRQGPFTNSLKTLTEEQSIFLRNMLEFNNQFVDYSSAEEVVKHKMKTEIICEISTLGNEELVFSAFKEYEDVIHSSVIERRCALIAMIRKRENGN